MRLNEKLDEELSNITPISDIFTISSIDFEDERDHILLNIDYIFLSVRFWVFSWHLKTNLKGENGISRI